MKAADLRQLSDEELQNKVKELKMDNFNLRVQQQLGQLEKPHRFRANRKDVARCLTILTQRQTEKAAPASK